MGGHRQGTDEEGRCLYLVPEGWEPTEPTECNEDGLHYALFDPATLERIEARARGDAQSFFDEFGEALDPEATDWDATAWQDCGGAADALGSDRAAEQVDAAFPYYQGILVSETVRLASLTP